MSDGDDPTPTAAPTRVGRYRVDAVLGEGGMGVVYRAFDEMLDRHVAIKVLHRGSAHAETMARLAREAQALASLSHPHVVSVFELELDRSPPFVVMEYVEGQTLAEWMQASEGPRPWREVVAMLDAAGQGLAAAHAQGIVHRDFKPHNVLVGRDGRARVLDFGLATLDGPAPRTERTPDLDEPSQDVRLTQTGTVMGTPAYMAPEQHLGHAVDALSDQFAFCVTLFEALHGRRPFGGASRAEIYVNTSRGLVEVPEGGPAIPKALMRVVRRGLAHDPSERWPDMESLLTALRRVGRRSPRWWGVAAGVGVTVTAVAWALYTPSCEPADAMARSMWDEPQRRAFEAAFGGAGAPEPDVLARLDAELTDYARGLAAASHRLCTDARTSIDPATLDRRSMCLTQRRMELLALIDVLSQPGPSLETFAPRAVSALEPVRECDSSASTPTVPPAIAEAVTRLRESMATVRALEAAGRYDEGSARARAVVEEARALDHEPVLAEALLHEGRLHAAAGRYPESRGRLEAAYLTATECEHDVVAIAAATKLVRVVGHELAEHEEGFTWARHARSLLERSETEGLPLARSMREEGSVWHSAGEYAKAQALHEQALEIIERELGPQHPEHADTLLVLGHAHWRQGDFEGATQLAERARGIYVERLGPGHPMVAEALNDLGVVAGRTDRFEDAMHLHQQALEIRRRTLGEDHAAVGRSYFHLGSAMMRLGHHEGMVEALERAVAIREGAYGAAHPDVIATRARLAMAMALDGDRDGAAKLAERLVEDTHSAYAPGHPRIYSLTATVAQVALLAGDLAAARRHFESLLATEAAADHHAEARSGLGDLALLDGDPEAALQHFEHSDRLQRALPARSRTRAETLLGLARACLELDRLPCARDAIDRIDGLDGVLPRQHQLAQHVREELASRETTP